MADVPNATQMRDALAWVTQDQAAANEPDKSTWAWLWEAIQGDFKQDRSTGQIAFDAAVSMVPIVDQICDVRDLIANCRAISQSKGEESTLWNWVALVLTLIGLFPSLGSLVKGVLKIFFLFVRKHGANKVAEAVDAAMTWVITYLRRPDVQRYLRVKKVDEVFKWLADQIRLVRGEVNKGQILAAFDKAIKVMQGLLEKVTWMPVVGAKAKATIEMVQNVHKQADKMIEPAIKPVQEILDRIVQRLEREQMAYRTGILNANNVHFRGGLPETTAVQLMKKKPRPKWLTEGQVLEWKPLKPNFEMRSRSIDPKVKEGWPALTDGNVMSFHKMAAKEIPGPARLYRIIAPNSRAMSDCWVSEEVFERIQSSPDPRTAWRKYLGVWPDWNGNGQFVIYDVKPGETLKVWRGPAAGQKKEGLTEAHLEGGWEQIVFNVPRGHAHNDTMRFYELGGGKGARLQKPMSQAEYDRAKAGMTREQARAFDEQHIGLREQINHSNISGPFDTGWGYFDDFAVEALPDRIGLPSLAGQTTTVR
jgi:hypothetical protein